MSDLGHHVGTLHSTQMGPGNRPGFRQYASMTSSTWGSR